MRLHVQKKQIKTLVKQLVTSVHAAAAMALHR